MSDSDTQPQKESYVDEARRRIAHLSHKLEEAQGRIRTLEFENAELVRWTNDMCINRLQELSDEMVNKYNQKQYRGKNFNELRWRSRETN